MDGNFDPSQFAGQMPDGMTPPDMNGEIPQRPDGKEFAKDGNGNPMGFGGEGGFDFGGRPQMGGNTSGADRTTASTEFYMQDKVNSFSGVGDYTL